MTARDDAAFLAAADLLDGGAVQPETRQRIRRALSQELRNELPDDARKAVADAYRANGDPVPDWCAE